MLLKTNIKGKCHHYGWDRQGGFASQIGALGRIRGTESCKKRGGTVQEGEVPRDGASLHGDERLFEDVSQRAGERPFIHQDQAHLY